MQLQVLPNLVGHSVTLTDDLTLSTILNPRPAGLTKEQHREWCASATTQSHFYSVWEGINPLARINTGNPPKLLHGIIADYDSINAMSKIQALPTSTGFLPTWITESFTPGKCRLIWPFEKPILITNPMIAEVILKELDAKIKISDALPGFDTASWKDTQYFELGSNWQSVQGAVPVPKSLLNQCIMEAGLKAKVVDSDTPIIPMDIIAAEVERQFPGRWQGVFDEGMRGPLFWIQDGIDRPACIVSENGMVCFSTRAPSLFVPWKYILGKKFVDKYEEERAGKHAEMFYFDSKTYWTKNGENWVFLNQDNAKLLLKVAGCSEKVRKGNLVSEIEKTIAHILTNRRVSAAVPILFNPNEVVDLNGERYLNTSSRKVMLPAEDGDPALWPFIYDFITNGFDGEQGGIPAWVFVFAWWKRFYESSLLGKPLPGQIFILAGEAHCGKTFFNKWIIGASVGGSVDAEPLLMRQTAFNKQGAEVALWRCDDAASDGDYQAKLAFAKSLKAMAANPTQLFQPKFRDAIELPFTGRVIVTTNIDPESIRVLPPMDASLKDKICLFKIKEGFHPEFLNNNYQNEERVMKELPHALRYLLNWNPPAELLDPKYKRFGMKAFQHEELVHAAQTETREYVFSEILEPWIQGKRNEKIESIDITATELLRDLLGMSDGSKALAGDFRVESVGKQLGKLLQQKCVPELVDKVTIKGKVKYRFVFTNTQEGEA